LTARASTIRVGAADSRVPVALAAVLACAYLIVAPDSADLAAQEFRAWLFGHAGFTLWDNSWYGGHPLPGYSLLFPPLGALLGVRLAGALSVVAAAALFAMIARRAFGPKPAVAAGAAWFAGGVALQLLTGRMAFLLGLAVGLAAVALAQRDKRVAAVLTAALATLASPVAGAFLALAGTAWAIGSRRMLGLGLAGGAVASGLAVAALFPESGSEPFAASAFWPAVLGLGLVAALLPADQRVLRAGAVLAGLLCLAAFVVPTPVGGNATRLAALMAGPLLVCLPLTGRRRIAVLAALPLLAYWQLMPPVRDAAVAAGDPSTQAAYYGELLDELRPRMAQGIGRVEVPFTRAHWEARYLAERVPLARGWQRQLDVGRNQLFYDKAQLTPARLHAWLARNSVRWVALPDVPLDRSGRREAALLRAGVPGVAEVWRGEHWTLYEVHGSKPLATGPATVSALEPAAFSVVSRRSGETLVRVRWSPYWNVVRGLGCVSRAPGGWTMVATPVPGRVRIAQSFSLTRGVLRAKSLRCSA
jgi:hypothetical protein